MRLRRMAVPRSLLDVDLFHIAATLFEKDTVSAVRTANATVCVEFDVALATRALVSHGVLLRADGVFIRRLRRARPE
jgi:hypothetical protein